MLMEWRRAKSLLVQTCGKFSTTLQRRKNELVFVKIFYILFFALLRTLLAGFSGISIQVFQVFQFKLLKAALGFLMNL